jgi:hypothetical protein
MTWCGASDRTIGGLGILTQLSPPPDIDSDYIGHDQVPTAGLPWDGDQGPLFEVGELLSTLVTSMPRATADAIADAIAPPTPDATARPYREPLPGVRRWAGGLAQIPDVWLPPVAILPRAHRDVDDPGTSWSTESIDFASRHSVHAKDVRMVADLLAPHVMALILDRVPDDAAVTVYGDALHIWWEYNEESRHSSGRVAQTVEASLQLANAFPSFVLAEYPDHSGKVEDRLAARAAEAVAYRAARDARLRARSERHQT